VGRVLGPILTTGVALAASGVVVANPIVVAPRADIQIPAVALSSGGDDMVGMLDPAFLDAIAPEAASVNPFAVIRDLISALAADAAYRGTNAIVEAFVAGVAVVTEPELTAAWSSYVPPTPDLPPLTFALPPGLDLTTIGPTPAQAPGNALVLPGVKPYIDATVIPAVYDFVGTLADDVTYVGREAVAAAFAAGAMVAAEPVLIYKTLRALVLGDFEGALDNAVKVVTAPLGPPLIIIDAMRTVVERHLSAMFAGLTGVPAGLQAAAAGQDLDAEAPSVASQQTRGVRAVAPRSLPADRLSVMDDGPEIPAPAASSAPAGMQTETEPEPAETDQVAEMSEPAADPEAADAAVAGAAIVEAAAADAGAAETEVAAPARRAATAARDIVTEPGARASGAVRGAAGGVAVAADRAGADDPAADGT
jgi:hypothetical protein